ncbi:MAG: PAS domain S-box protein [Nostoc sp. ChiSLP02]|nr:PAS domain S-box protein [Nostoc sp. DedSLP05]MDZ8103093.1 PAS domain S-box protein [Nostoc sp. DedSLP01]MDZ8183350.1 PAS domain S-box protein [Nostoc sp. ChiSLP02]
MQALSQFIELESLESIIDWSPLMVVPETSLSDTIALMAAQNKSVLVGSCSHLVGCLTKQDIVKLIASGTDLKTAKISEVMHTSVKTFKMSEFQEISCVLSLLCQQQLHLLPVVDNQGQVIGIITPESICQGLTPGIEKPTDRYQQPQEQRDLLESGVANAAFAANESEKIYEFTHSDRDTTAFEIPCESEQCFCIIDDTALLVDRSRDTKALGNFVCKSSLETLLDPENCQKFADSNSCAIASITSYQLEYRIFFERHLSEYKWLLRRVIVRKNTTAQLARFIGVSVDITTSRVQAKKEQLRQSQQMLQLVMDTIEEAVCPKDRNSIFMGCNCNFGQIFLTIAEAWLRETQKSYGWYFLRALLICDRQGKFLIYLSNIYEIFSIVKQQALLKCKLAQQVLKHREERFRNLVEASSDWVWEVDENTVYTYISPNIREILGYEATEILGKTPFDLMLPKEAERVIQIFAPIAAAQQPFKCLENINIHQDGYLVVLETSGVPIFDAEGKFCGYHGMVRDITKRKQQEAALFLSQQQLQYLVSFSPAVIYTCKIYGDFGITFISENVTTVTGYQARRFVENSNFWATHIHPEDINPVFAQLSKILEHEQYTIEYRFLHQDGTYRWIYDQGKLVRDRTGNPIEIVGYLVDITERKQLEQELRIALEKEKQLSELKSRFVSMTSHEFRTPLSTILSSCELLEHYRHKWTQEKQLTHLHRIQTAVKRMTEMLNDVLVIGKAGTGKFEYKPTSFDLVKYCQKLVEEIQMNLNNQRLISFISQYESIPCCMDAQLLAHILNNLLSNAIKYSADDSIVKFSLSCKNGQAVFEIQDWGIGIPEEDLPFLFESFHRARNVGNILGTGLGMTIVKKCLELHQGEIFVKSTVSLGTKFTVKISLNNKI